MCTVTRTLAYNRALLPSLRETSGRFHTQHTERRGTTPHARVYARVPTAMLFFCCHKCHTTEKDAGKGGTKTREMQVKTDASRCAFFCVRLAKKPYSLKYTQAHTIKS